MNNDIIIQFQNLHFTPSEAKVYLALTEIGQTRAGNIIKRTKLHRSVVYECLDKLINKKLVFKLIKKNVAYYQPTDPLRILDEAKNQQEIAANLVKSLKTIASQKLPEITIYQGIESYRRFWLRVIKTLPERSTDYIAGSIGAKWQEYLGSQTRQYLRIKSQRKIKWKMIVFEKDPLEVKLLEKDPKLNEYRLIEKEISLAGNFNILADQSLILHSVTEPMVIEIKNETLVRVFQNLFDILWQSAKPI